MQIPYAWQIILQCLDFFNPFHAFGLFIYYIPYIPIYLHMYMHIYTIYTYIYIYIYIYTYRHIYIYIYHIYLYTIYPSKSLENQKFSDIFWKYRKRPVSWNWLKRLFWGLNKICSGFHFSWISWSLSICWKISLQKF